jgi:hypothetical protein
VLDWDGVDAFEVREVLKDYGHVEVLDSIVHTLESHRLYIVDVHDKEWKLADGDEAVLGRSHLHHGLIRASSEIQILNGYVELDDPAAPISLAVLLRLLFDQLDEVSEFIVQLDLLLPLALLLLQFVHICESLPRSLIVQIVFRDTCLLEELDILDLLSTYHYRNLQVEVNNNDQFILCTGLEEGMLDVREGNIHVVALGGDETDSILVNLQVTCGLLAHYVGSNDQTLKHLFLALDDLDVLN